MALRLCVALAAMTLVGTAASQPVQVWSNAGSSLEAGWTWALQQSDEAIVVWVVDAPSNHWRWSGDRRPLAELFGGGATLEDRSVVFAHTENGRIRKIHSVDLRSSYGDSDRTLRFIGEYTQEETYGLLSGIRYTEEARKDRLYVLSTLERVPEVDPIIREALTDRDDDIRKGASYALANYAGPDALPALERIAAEDGSREVRKAAVYAIGNVGTTRAREFLLALIMREQ